MSLRLRFAVRLVLIAVLSGWAAAANAVYLSERGQAAYLSGAIDAGDAAALEAFLAKPRAAPIKVIYLYSFGGRVVEAMEMAGILRKRGVATAVEARSTRCDSACTMLFAGGVQRYYVDGDSVYEGNTGFYGLGYHPSHNRGFGRNPDIASGRGTEIMERFYQSMGQPGAIQMMRLASIDTLFRPNGQTALKLKLATSLARPPY